MFEQCQYVRYHRGRKVRCKHRLFSSIRSQTRWCAYHRKGGVSPSHGWHRCASNGTWKTQDPNVGDLRQHNGALYKFNGRKWRRCCCLCMQYGRPKYCNQHNPELTARARQSSKDACDFFDFLTRVTGLRVQHQHHHARGWVDGAEYRIPNTPFRVDGYVARHRLVIEFLGDFWHANPALFPPEESHRAGSGLKNAEVHQKSVLRLQNIAEQGYVVYFVWASEWATWKRKHPQALSSPPSLSIWAYLERIAHRVPKSTTLDDTGSGDRV